jgi:transposase InsO family protein
LGEPGSVGVATVEHHGHRVLRVGTRGSLAPLRQTGDLQWRSRQPVLTSAIFTATLSAAGVRISMDGRGRWMDNVFIERLLRSLKYEDIYLKGYADGHEAKRGIADWVTFYKPRIGTPIRLCH